MERQDVETYPDAIAVDNLPPIWWTVAPISWDRVRAAMDSEFWCTV